MARAQVCRVCAETFPGDAANCPRCGFASGTATPAVQVGGPSPRKVDSHGFSVDTTPQPQATATSGVPLAAVPSGVAPAVSVGGRRSSPVGWVVQIGVLAMVLGGGGAIVNSITEAVSEVTDQFDTGFDPPSIQFDIDPPSIAQPPQERSPGSCAEALNRYVPRLLRNINSQGDLTTLFEQAALELPVDTFQTLVEVITARPAVIQAAATGNARKAIRLAKPLIDAACRKQ